MRLATLVSVDEVGKVAVIKDDVDGEIYSFPLPALGKLKSPSDFLGEKVKYQIDGDAMKVSLVVRGGTTFKASKKAEKEESGFSFFQLLIFGGIALWLFYGDGLKSLTAAYAPAFEKLTCDSLGKRIKGEKLQNAFGGSFEIISVTNIKTKSKDKSKISCTADAILSNGEARLTFDATKQADGDVIYSVESNAN